MLIGNNYIYMIYLGLIYLPFSVIDTYRRIELFLYFIYWIQKLCSSHFWLDELCNIKILLKVSIHHYYLIYEPLFLPCNIWRLYVFIMSLFLVHIKIYIHYIFYSTKVFNNKCLIGNFSIEIFYNSNNVIM